MDHIKTESEKVSSIMESDEENDSTVQSASKTIFIKKEDLDPNRVDKDVLISPYNKENFKGENYLLTLGSHYFSHETMTSSINPESKKSLRKYWGDPKKASKMSESEIETNNLSPKDRYIKISSGRSILCHTHEFIGISEGMEIIFKPISRLSTALIDIKITTGGNYFDRCILAIKNNSDSCVYLREGSFISEVTFFRASQPKMQNGFGKDKLALKQIERNWKPENLFVSNLIDT